MWKPVRADDDTQDKKIILNIAKKQLEKDFVKITKKLEKTSEELGGMCPFANSKKRVASKRNKLSAECFERDEIEKRLKIIEE